MKALKILNTEKFKKNGIMKYCQFCEVSSFKEMRK